MNDAALAVAQARYALKGFLREPWTFVYTLVLPLFLLATSMISSAAGPRSSAGRSRSRSTTPRRSSPIRSCSRATARC